VAAAVNDINLDPTFADIDRSARAILAPPGYKYWIWIGFLLTLTLLAGALWTRQVYVGLQVTGLGDPVMWAVYITNFVFWVGIAHSGTLISAILFLFRTRWRTAVYRAAETMTIFAVATAGLFPIIHLGRPWFFYWLAPYPNQRYLQPDFRSPLVWDLFAIGTYLTISSLFWFTGLIPDVANVREVATGWRKKLYTIVALGWQGSDRQWRHFSMAYLLLAGLATPLVLSVHSVVSWDFAMAQLPGWHSTIFAPYFVAGAIFSGVAMVLTLLIPMRWIMGLEDLITPWHLDNLAKVILLTSFIISYAYCVESFMTWYSQDPIEMMTFHMRYFGPWGWMFWVMVACNCVIPLALFSPRIRTSPVPLFIVAIFVNIGMWFERFVIIAGSLAVNFEPSQWRFWHPSLTEMMITVGSFAWFVMLFSLFARFMPIISMTEVKEGITWLKQALRQGYAKAA
jgi:molybdopterin-containing oxidoreductase family membrane subunit